VKIYLPSNGTAVSSPIFPSSLADHSVQYYCCDKYVTTISDKRFRLFDKPQRGLEGI
jgi:hypothetical protein